MRHRRVRPFAVLTSVLSFALAVVALLPYPSHAQDCVTAFKDSTGNLITDGGTACQVASGNKCAFQLSLCVNQQGTTGGTCTPQSLSPKKIRASGHCGAVGKLSLVPSGTDALCQAAPATINVRTMKDNAGTCKIRTKGGPLTKIALTCMPSTGTCGTTTTTITGTSTTSTSSTSTTLPVPPMSFSFTTLTGTPSCGGPALNPPPSAPLVGQVFSDTGLTTSIGNLGSGCLYIGGGNATTLPGAKIPDGATSFYARSGDTLSASAGTGMANCTQGAKATSHCLKPPPKLNQPCVTDADCDVTVPGSCTPDERCFFGPPLPIPNGGLSTCVVNAIATDAGGTFNAATGDVLLSLPLSSRVYLTGNNSSPCPKCVSGSCVLGQNAGQPCTPAGSTGTTLQCQPLSLSFLATLSVTLAPLSTGSQSKTASDGNFCPGQGGSVPGSFGLPGAFGKVAARGIAMSGAPTGNLLDELPHAGVLSSLFCIPPTGNGAIDGSADLPGPGGASLNGNAQLN
jgi:hypothetical protein